MKIDSQIFTITSHYVGEESLDKGLYKAAFERANAETAGQVRRMEKGIAISGFLRYNRYFELDCLESDRSMS